MAKRICTALLCLAGMSGVAAADLPVFGGKITIVSLSSSTCPGTVGQKLPAAMRVRVKTTQTSPETLTVAISQLAGGVFVRAEDDGTFAGADQAVSGTYVLGAK